MAVTYLTTATLEFLALQSGLARPYWEVNISVSATAATWSGTLGQAYEANNDILSIGTIDREKSITISGTDKLIAGDITIQLNNASGIYSPLNSVSGIFYNKDWFNSIVKIWSGFYSPSGTALVLQNGTFILEELELNSKNGTAYLKCKDKLAYALAKYVGLPGPSGTSSARLWTGTHSAGSIIVDLLSGLSLTAGDYDITAAGIDFVNLSVSGMTYGTMLGKMVAASDSFIYVDNFGKIRFKPTTSNFGTERTKWEVGISDMVMQNKYTTDIKNLINVVAVNYEPSLASYNSSEKTATVPKGRTFVTDNQLIQTRAQAQTFTSRNLSDFSNPLSFLEMENLWMPAVELGDYFDVTDPNLFLSGTAYRTFEVYKIRSDISRFKQTFYLREASIGAKIGYLSDTATDANSVIYTGAWSSGFGFLSYETGTAAYPGFDAGTGETLVHSGANNNAIDNSGAPNTSIEQPFVLG